DQGAGDEDHHAQPEVGDPVGGGPGMEVLEGPLELAPRQRRPFLLADRLRQRLSRPKHPPHDPDSTPTPEEEPPNYARAAVSGTRRGEMRTRRGTACLTPSDATSGRAGRKPPVRERRGATQRSGDL